MSLSSEEFVKPEIQEDLTQKDLAFAFIKPDYIDDVTKIEEILQDNGLNILYSDRMRLSEQSIDYMYRDSQDTHFYDAMKKYLMMNDVIVLLIDGRRGETQEILTNLKKSAGKDGIIRQKIQKNAPVSQSEIELWQSGKHPLQDTLSVILTQRNVIHTADNPEEAINSARAILGKKFDSMVHKGNLPSELWKLFGAGH
ncbi:MAG: nucleoside-diphosphate kinase [Patescibacteria group bacterium]